MRVFPRPTGSEKNFISSAFNSGIKGFSISESSSKPCLASSSGAVFWIAARACAPDCVAFFGLYPASMAALPRCLVLECARIRACCLTVSLRRGCLRVFHNLWLGGSAFFVTSPFPRDSAPAASFCAASASAIGPSIRLTGFFSKCSNRLALRSSHSSFWFADSVRARQLTFLTVLIIGIGGRPVAPSADEA